MNLIKDVFQYESKQVYYIKIGDELFFRANDVANMLLYKSPESIVRDMLPRYKVTYNYLIEKVNNIKSQSMGEIPILHPSKKNQRKTIFLNEPGFYSIIGGSQMEKALEVRWWLYSEVMPSLRKYGCYSINTNFIDYKSIFNHTQICDYINKNILYISYIGVYNNEQLFKFGWTTRAIERLTKEHPKTYDKFEVMYITECNNYAKVEQYFKGFLESRKVYRVQTINNNKQIELFSVNDKFTLETAKQKLDELIEEYKLEVEKDNDNLNEKVKSLQSQLNTDRKVDKVIRLLSNDNNDDNTNYNLRLKVYNEVINKCETEYELSEELFNETELRFSSIKRINPIGYYIINGLRQQIADKDTIINDKNEIINLMKQSNNNHNDEPININQKMNTIIDDIQSRIIQFDELESYISFAFNLRDNVIDINEYNRMKAKVEAYENREKELKRHIRLSLNKDRKEKVNSYFFLLFKKHHIIKGEFDEVLNIKDLVNAFYKWYRRNFMGLTMLRDNVSNFFKWLLGKPKKYMINGKKSKGWKNYKLIN